MDDEHSPLLGKPSGGGALFYYMYLLGGWVMCHVTYVEIREQFVRILLMHHVSPID